MEEGISVCIPARNSEWCLPECLNSLETQSVKPDEYVICVGPSRDKTENVVKNFLSRSEVLVKIVYDEMGLGTGFARKTLVDNVSNPYILWIDSDCIAPQNWIEAHRKLLQTHNYDVISGKQIGVSEKAVQEIKKNAALTEINMSSLSTYPINTITQGNCLMRRDVVLKAGNYDPLFTRGQDWDMTIRLRAMEASMGKCEKLICLHRGWRGKYVKSFKGGTFLKFIYKYGLKYALYNPMHLASFSLRASFLLSMFFLTASIIYTNLFLPSILLLFSSLTGLIFGKYKKRGLKLRHLITELCKSFGEFLTIIEILSYKHREKFGYGKTYLTS